MNDMIKSLALDSQVQVKIVPPFYEPYSLDMNSPIAKIFKEVYKERVGKLPVFKPHRGIVDANVFVAEGGIPTIVFGPKGGNHHRAGEYVELSSLKPVTDVFIETTLRFFENSGI